MYAFGTYSIHQHQYLINATQTYNRIWNLEGDIILWNMLHQNNIV